MLWDTTISTSLERYLQRGRVTGAGKIQITYPSPSRSLWRPSKCPRNKGLHMAQGPIWTRARHRVGLERPHFGTRFRAQSDPWVAPAQQETSFGTRGENFGEAGEEGRNYALQLRLHHLLHFVMRISLGQNRKLTTRELGK